MNADLYFEYGTTTAYSKRVDAVPASVSGNTPISVSANISELTANNTNTIKKVNANPLMIAGDMNTPFTAELKGLLPSHQYRCRIVCTIGDKTYYGAYFSFTTAYKQGHFEYEKDKQ